MTRTCGLRTRTRTRTCDRGYASFLLLNHSLYFLVVELSSVELSIFSSLPVGAIKDSCIQSPRHVI